MQISTAKFSYHITIDMTVFHDYVPSLLVDNPILSRLFGFEAIATNSVSFDHLDECTRAAMEWITDMKSFLSTEADREFTISVYKNPFIFDLENIHEYDEDFMNLFDESTVTVITLEMEDADYYGCRIDICADVLEDVDLMTELSNQQLVSRLTSTTIH